MSKQKPVPGTGGEHYIPYEERSGEKSTVYFTRDLSAEGLRKIFGRVKETITGNVGIKLHTGEAHGPNIIPRPWVKNLIEKDLPGAAVVETNSYYEGDRYTTEQHRKTLEINGWNFCPVDIMDGEGTAAEPVVTPNIGILASRDILAVDQASVDLVYALKEEDRHALTERIESRHGLRQLTYMKELHMGNDRYHLIDIDREDKEISPEEAVKGVVPFKEEK